MCVHLDNIRLLFHAVGGGHFKICTFHLITSTTLTSRSLKDLVKTLQDECIVTFRTLFRMFLHQRSDQCTQCTIYVLIYIFICQKSIIVLT